MRLRGAVVPVVLLGIARAQLPGTFTPTGDMTTARSGHTQTLLPNGTVLIAGGRYQPLQSPSFSLAGAELYDPTTGTFTATGSMTTPRQWHTATLLPDGKVLIAGGGNCITSDPCWASAELYDPSSGTFTATGKMTAARRAFTATLLNNGKVLIAGGDLPGAVATATAELYDPSTGRFTATGQMTAARDNHTASLLPDGEVLMIGSGWWPVPGAELYDPETGAFRSVAGTIPSGPFGRPRTTQMSILLTNGKVLTMLEDAESGNPAGAAIYDPANSVFAPAGETAALTTTATLLPDGTVLATGYPLLNTPPGGLNALRYDPVSGAFYPTGDMTTPRAGHSATLLLDGAVLVAGGQLVGGGVPCCDTTLSAAELYHPPVVIPAPVLFSLSGDGRGSGAILHATNQQVVSPDNPAAPGEVLEIYGTGLIDGGVIPPQVAIGGMMAEVLYFGKAPGFEGLNQINVRVPAWVTRGDAVGVRMNYLSRPSNEVTIAVQ